MFWTRDSVPRRLVLAATLIIAVGAAYAFSLRGGFLWDDDLHVTANPTIVGPLGLKEIWTSARANYFPLVLTNFWLQHALWGVDPLGYRVVTLAFHVIAALLLWLVLRQLRVPGAWLGAAIWALHPVQVESVAWICELKNTQSAVFFLAAIAAWIRHLTAGVALDRRMPGPPGTQSMPSRGGYALSLVCAFLAILSKPSTVMLPVALGLCTWWVRGRLGWRDAVRLAPFFALSGLAAGWTIWEQKFHSGAIGVEWSQTPAERIAIAGRVIWFYLGKLAWPEPLMFIYPRWKIHVEQPLAWTAALMAIAGLFLLWRGRDGRLRPVLFAAVYFVALLFPVLGFFSVYFFRYSFVGDHFQYLASMGPLALAGAGIATAAGWAGRHGRIGPAAFPHGMVVAVVLIALGLLTARQSRVYLSNETLWRDTLAHNPGAAMAWLNLADTFAQAERYDEAIATFKRAIEVQPSDPDGWNDLGNVLVLTGRPAEALSYFERALQLKPASADAHSNLGNALRSLGRSNEAIAHYRRALELKPDHPGALNNLGAELAQQGKPGEALPLFERALALNPADAAVHDNFAGALRELGRRDEAMIHHEAALRLKPRFAEAYANLGRTLVLAGRREDALRQFERALELKPAFVTARSHYAATLAALGRATEALAQLTRAVELAPNSAEAQLNLGSALAQTGQMEEAISHFEAAIRLAPDFASAHANLANAFLGLRRWPKAIAHLEIAAKLQPESAVVHTQLAIAHVNNDQMDAAVPHFETALRLNPRAADVHDNYAQVLNALGRRREAFEHFEAAAELRRTGPR